MFLKYGINKNTGELIFIEQLTRGRQPAIVCPYCQTPLIAKKGDINAHHFAHDGDTCNAANRDVEAIALPLFDRFDLHLSGKDWELLKKFKNRPDYYTAWEVRTLIADELIQEGYKGGLELSKKGKIPFGDLSLMLFNEFQKELFEEKHDKLHDKAFERDGYPDFDMYLADLRLYRAQWRRVLMSSLYFIEVQHAAGVLHKIGITIRPIEERLAEIQHDVYPHIGAATFKVLDVWQHRANIELYFKHRYSSFQHRMGSLTEYFSFPDSAAITRDLRRVKKEELTPLERNILAGKLSEIEQTIYQREIEARRRSGIKAGMERALKRGVRLGRPSGNLETDEQFMSKPKSQAVINALQQGMSIRQTMKAAGVSINTVQKVKALIKQRESKG